jgi:hypothetical protein
LTISDNRDQVLALVAAGYRVVVPISVAIAKPKAGSRLGTEPLMIASPNYSVALLGIKATFIRFRLIDKY